MDLLCIIKEDGISDLGDCGFMGEKNDELKKLKSELMSLKKQQH